MRRSRIRRRRCLGTKRVSGWSRLALGCHAQTIRERDRERERERETERDRETEEYQSVTISKRKKRMVHMHEKCINM